MVIDWLIDDDVLPLVSHFPVSHDPKQLVVFLKTELKWWVEPRLTISSVTRGDGGTYICKAENILGSTPDTSLVMIYFLVWGFKVHPTREVNSVIDQFVFICRVWPRVTWNWQSDGKSSLPVESNFLQNGTLLIRDIKKPHEGSYTCRATNALTIIEA